MNVVDRKSNDGNGGYEDNKDKVEEDDDADDDGNEI